MAHRRTTATNPVDQALCGTHQGLGAQLNSRCTSEKKEITLEEKRVQGGVFRGRITHTRELGASNTTKNVHCIAQCGRGVSQTTAHHAHTLGFGGLEPYAPYTVGGLP